MAPLALILTATACLCACQSSAPDGTVARFDELRLGRPAAPPSPSLEPAPAPGSAAFAQSDEPPPLKRRTTAAAGAPILRPRETAPLEPAPVLPVTLDAAAGRVTAYLDRAGFALEERADGGGQLVSATRMGAPAALSDEAVCGLEAMHRPDISSTDLTVRLTPAPGGVQLETTARFVEIDTKIIAGTLTRQTCRSRGVLEAAVRRAALGG